MKNVKVGQDPRVDTSKGPQRQAKLRGEQRKNQDRLDRLGLLATRDTSHKGDYINAGDSSKITKGKKLANRRITKRSVDEADL